MNYTLDRYLPQAPTDDMIDEAYKGLQKLSTMVDKLDVMFAQIDKKKKDNKQAEKSMLEVIKMAEKLSRSGEVENDVDVVGDLIGKLLKWVGKKIIKTVVKRVVTFAARVGMQIARFAVRTVARYVIVPIFEAVAAFAVANPITAALLGVAGVGYGAYKLYKHYFPDQEQPEEVMAPIEVAEGGAQAVVTGESAVQQEEAHLERRQLSTTEKYVTQPITQAAESFKQTSIGQRIESFVSKPEPKTSKFKGFGGNMDQYIAETAQRFPILPVDQLRAFIQMERGWNGAMSPTGAIGAGQFTGGTWNDLIRKYDGDKIGMIPITGFYEQKGRPSIQANPKGGNFRTPQDPRFNQRVNTLATGLLASKNAEILKKAGLPITWENLYMMHNIGAQIINVMKGKKANAATWDAIKKNGWKAGMTEFDFLEFQKARIRKAYQEANATTAAVGEDAKMSKGIAVAVASKAAKKPKEDSSNDAPLKAASADLIKGPGQTIVAVPN